MNHVSIGDQAPDFEVNDIYNNTVKLSSYKGEKVLLVFFRFASCPLCTVRFMQLVQDCKKYQAQGIRVIAVFESSADYIKTYITNSQSVPFSIIPDLEGRLYKLYGVKKSFLGMMLGMFRVVKMFKGLVARAFKMGRPDGSVMRVPADFLIDEFQRIVDSYYGTDIGDHIPMKRIRAFAGI